MRTVLVVAVLLAGCTTRQSIGAPPPGMVAQADVAVPMHDSGKVDVLFMMDNSSSMGPMQAELQSHFADMIRQVSGLATGATVDLHIGIVTSDYGAGDQAGGGCDASPGGQRGALQTMPSLLATNPPAGCQPPVGAPFISYSVAADGTITNNLPPNQDLVQTFTCMASVGSKGCGFEHQLESVYAALHGDAATSGFLRDDAALTIVFVTNEDDGSAPPTAKFYEQANDPNGTSLYGQYSTYRQTRFAVACGSPLALPPEGATMGDLMGCVAAPAVLPTDIGLAYDVSRYINFFTSPRAMGGLKDAPWDVALVAVAPPPTPFRTRLVDPAAGLTPYQDCAGAQPSSTCLVALDHSCENKVDPGFFGDPAVRLSAVVNSAAIHQYVSICGDDLNAKPSYAAIMTQVGTLMGSQAIGGCLFEPPVNPSVPTCAVTMGGRGAMANVADCKTGAMPCWAIETDTRCPTMRDPSTGDTEQLRLVVHGVAPDVPLQATCRVYTSP